MDNFEPLVSIIITTYNSSNYIENTILNATNQTYQNKEIIICDNDSKDNTLEKVNKIKKFSKIKSF